MSVATVGSVFMDSHPFNERIQRDSLVVCLCSLASKEQAMTPYLTTVLGNGVDAKYDTFRTTYITSWKVGESHLHYLGSHAAARMLAFVPYIANTNAGTVQYTHLKDGLVKAMVSAIRGGWSVVIPQLSLAPKLDEDVFFVVLHDAIEQAEAETRQTITGVTLHTSEMDDVNP